MRFAPEEKVGEHRFGQAHTVRNRTDAGPSPLQGLETALLLQRSLGNRYLEAAGEVDATLSGLPFSDTFEQYEGCVIRRFRGCEGACAGCRQQEDDDRQAIQAKLIVGDAGDRYEQEADRTADRVMRLSATGEGLHPASTGTSLIQRQEAEETADDPLRAQIEALLAEDGLQAKAENDGITVTEGFESTLAGTKGGGHSIPNPTKTEMETAFGADFSGVRLHTDSTAVQMSRQINAHAFTHGQDIYFNEAIFNPSTKEGKHLLAHELTHTLQQSGEKIQRLTISRNSRVAGNC